MSRLGSWFRSTTSRVSPNDSAASSSAELVAKQMADIEDAMAAADAILNDDIEGAGERLKKGDSVFHQLGLAVTIFMRSILGFEKDIMSDAATKLAESENRAWADMKKAQGRPSRSIYPSGTEYALIHAETQLMSAVVAVMHESLTEAFRGFYKLRKAFIALDAIIAAEAKVIEGRNSVNGAQPASPIDDKMPGSFDDDEFVEVFGGGEEDSDRDFVDARDGQSGVQTPANKDGVPGTPPDKVLEGLRLDSMPPTPGNEADCPPLELKSRDVDITTDVTLFTSPMDIFIHSGASMCFGILLLIISMVPPAFSRLLYIIGFKGDRPRGIRLLWRSTAVPNVNGGISALVLLAYYNGLLGYADIQPSEEDFDEDAISVGYPTEKCADLLVRMRKRYPNSRLWRLEEARVLGNRRRLSEAIELLSTGEDSKMRQVMAINNFELSINSLFLQDWTLTRKSFLRCIELNDWSHTMYYYMAGCAELELYRNAFHATPPEVDEVRRRKKAAEELFRKAPTVAGRKKLMTRQLPFEVFVIRKIQKWEERAKDLGVDLADAVGVSPAMEMAYLWNGIKKMNEEQLAKAILGLEWSRCTASDEALEAMKAIPDEAAIRLVSMASVLRRQQKYSEARAMIEELVKSDRYLHILG